MSKDSARKILVVDDNDDIREMLAVLLDMQGYKVVVASDGEEAVSVATREEPDVILMDVMMPKLDGLEAARRINQNPKLNRVPIIGLSAFSDPLTENGQSNSFSWTAYLRKPIDVDELERLLIKTLRNAHESAHHRN
ncbi:MAG TPA: response regulator [Blastocatellia bacterium]|nr:response regulator [Blastocatellia bacterium]